VRLNGRPIAEREMGRRLLELRDDARLPPLTFFEYTTLAAFEAFRAHGCDVVVLEVGLGGRLDSTNVVTPAVTVVTNIGLDHTHILGDSLRSIAREKAGIIKARAPHVSGVRDPVAAAVITERVRRAGTSSWRIDRDFELTPVGERRGRPVYEARVRDELIDNLTLGLSGAHQPDNAACAVAALVALRGRGLDVPNDAIRAGLAKVRWPGRLEWLPSKGGRPAFLLDAAHNPDGCRVLARELERRAHEGRVVLLFGAMVDKEHGPMLAALDGVVDKRIYVTPGVTRAARADKFPKLRPGVAARSVRAGLERAVKLAGPEGVVVVAGSIHLLGEVRADVLGLRCDPPIAM
jgi:dihydrofolate synthase/folylpolyglutamate synthase